MTTPIDYAPPLPWFRRRHIRRAAIWITVLLLLAIAAFHFGPGVYRRARILYWQNRCMTHVDPPGTVIADIAVSPTSGLDRDLELPCRDIQQLNDASPGLPLSAIIIFLHARNCPAGERLIAVDFSCPQVGTSPNAYEPEIQISILQPASPGQDLQTIFTFRCFGGVFSPPLAAGQTLSIYAGLPDPADPAAFTIPYDLDGTRHEARLRLNAAGDNVELISVTPPL